MTDTIVRDNEEIQAMIDSINDSKPIGDFEDLEIGERIESVSMDTITATLGLALNYDELPDEDEDDGNVLMARQWLTSRGPSELDDFLV